MPNYDDDAEEFGCIDDWDMSCPPPCERCGGCPKCGDCYCDIDESEEEVKS